MKSQQLSSFLKCETQNKTMARKTNKKTSYERGTQEHKIQTIQKLGYHLFSESKDSKQVFLWYADSLGHFGLRVSNKVKVTCPTIDEAISEMEAQLMLEAESRSDRTFKTIEDAIDFYDSLGDEYRRTLKDIDKKKHEIEELFSKLESFGVNLKLKGNE
jgi:hypothetical protein